MPTLIFAALDEELVYRLAIPAVIAAALRLGNVRPNAARIAGLAGRGPLVLPAARATSSRCRASPASCPTPRSPALSAFIVYRSGSILPMAIGHAISNLLTVLMFRDAVPADARSHRPGHASSACWCWPTGRPARLTVADDGGLVDTQTGLAVDRHRPARRPAGAGGAGRRPVPAGAHRHGPARDIPVHEISPERAS